jgi:hypothetical protein
VIPTKVTAKLLRSLGANCQGLEDFKRVFPKGATITLDNCLKAAEARLDIFWFALHFLSAPAWEAYEKAIAPAWEAYEKAIALALEAYETAIAPAREAYETAIAPAWETYETARAIAFFEIYEQEIKKGTREETNE